MHLGLRPQLAVSGYVWVYVDVREPIPLPSKLNVRGRKLPISFVSFRMYIVVVLNFFFFKIDLAVSEIIITLFLWMMILSSRFVPIVKEIW